MTVDVSSSRESIMTGLDLIYCTFWSFIKLELASCPENDWVIGGIFLRVSWCYRFG